MTYNEQGKRTSLENLAGQVTTTAWDSCHKVSETYPVRYTYDIFGNKTTMMTYRDETSRTGGSPVQDEGTFSWSYLPGSDLKSSLSYPNGIAASWTYDANNQLLQVCNATPTNVISQYDYTYDAAGRRVACGKSGSAFTQIDAIAYAYNNRSELGKCKKCWYKVLLVAGDGFRDLAGNAMSDYHWYRQNDDGSWSHKPGDHYVIDGVSDPERDAKGRGYTTISLLKRSEFIMLKSAGCVAHWRTTNNHYHATGFKRKPSS